MSWQPSPQIRQEQDREQDERIQQELHWLAMRANAAQVLLWRGEISHEEFLRLNEQIENEKERLEKDEIKNFEDFE